MSILYENRGRRYYPIHDTAFDIGMNVARKVAELAEDVVEGWTSDFGRGNR